MPASEAAALCVASFMDGQSSSKASPRFQLRWEIAFALAVKIALVLVIKIVFFSNSPSKTEVATRIADHLAGGGQVATEFQPQRTTQELEKP